MVAKKGV